MLPDNKNNMVLENNLNNVQEKDGIKYINNEKASSISKETTRGKRAFRNGPILQNIETYDLLEDAKRRGKNCVNTGTYRNNRKY